MSEVIHTAFSLEAEQAVICSLLNDPRLAAVAANKLTDECFYHNHTQTVYSAIMCLYRRFQLVDTVTVTNYLRDNGKLDAVGGTVALMELYTFLPVPGVFDAYAEILVEKHAMRQIVSAATSIVQATKSGERDSAAIIENAVSEFQRLAQSRLNNADMLPCRDIRAIVNDVVDKAEERAKHAGRIPGITTGFGTIDEKTGGQQPGRLWVVAAETSEGKSTLVQNFIEHACDNGHAGAIYSFEMADTECVERLLCSRGPVENEAFMRGMTIREDQDRCMRAMNEIKNWNLAVVDVAEATIEQICRDITLRVSVLRKSDSNACFVAAIDYLQLANTLQRFDNRERAVAHISKTAKQCAKANGITIHMPSQLNDDGKLRESRAIAHDADVVMLIRRPKDAKKDEQDKRELFCAKNRGGKRNWAMPIKLQGHHFKFVTP